MAVEVAVPEIPVLEQEGGRWRRRAGVYGLWLAEGSQGSYEARIAKTAWRM